MDSQHLPSTVHTVPIEFVAPLLVLRSSGIPDTFCRCHHRVLLPSNSLRRSRTSQESTLSQRPPARYSLNLTRVSRCCRSKSSRQLSSRANQMPRGEAPAQTPVSPWILAARLRSGVCGRRSGTDLPPISMPDGPLKYWRPSCEGNIE